MNNSWKEFEVVDLFCGVGGLTHGFQRQEFDVIAGYDIDQSSQYAYEANNNSVFIKKDIRELRPSEILALYTNRERKILVGCAPCQPFSSLTNKQNESAKKWDLISYFGDLICSVQPEIISMENVPRLLKFQKGQLFENFLSKLVGAGYNVHYEIVDCRHYGIPQSRKRLVLLGSKLGKINLIPPTHSAEKYVSVKETIGDLPPIEDGEQHPADPMHRASKLSPLNKKRITNTPRGGSWKDWDSSLVLDCHKKESGKSYPSIYGRMKWEEPSPTLTTLCIGLGNGRFGHPEQNRAISLREAALLQTFPMDYKFFEPQGEVRPTIISRHIGNAVPVKLGEVIAISIKRHLMGLEGNWQTLK